MDAVRTTEAQLRTFVIAALVKVGVSDVDASTVADVLVAADLRDMGSHGVACLPSYVDAIRAGTLDPAPRESIVRETPTSIVIDAGNGLGQPVAKRAMLATIAKAKVSGMAFGAVRNSNHYGIAGYYAMLALEHEMIGIATSDAAPLAAPTFGREPLLGANPWAYAVPAGREPAFVLDFATTTERYGTLGGLGVEHGGHKGYGLGLLVQLMCSTLAGGDVERPEARAHFCGAIAIDRLRDPVDFRDAMDHELRAFRESARAPGVERIYVAGEIEHEATLARRRDGVPLEPTCWAEFERLAHELAVPPLTPLER